MITGTQLNVIQQALLKRTKKVSLNNTWRMLHDSEAIGRVRGRDLHLDDLDFVRLDQIYKQYRKVEADIKIPKGLSRFEHVKYSINEKDTNKSVFSDYLVFASVKAALPLKSGMLDISHPKFLATIDINEVDTSAIKQLVIVENGDMMVHLYKWHQYLPEQWHGSLFLYRGQGKNIKLVNELLERLADTAKIAVYSDFDPSGLLIVLNYISSRDLYIVVPKDWQNLDEEHSSNRLQIYLKQISQSINFDEAFAKHTLLNDIFQHMKHKKLAIMQENVHLMNGLEVIRVI